MEKLMSAVKGLADRDDVKSIKVKSGKDKIKVKFHKDAIKKAKEKAHLH